MKVVILAGGKGTRFIEETNIKPKPMIEIGGKPILWHIMKRYLSFGIKDFIICSGYLSKIIEEYFNFNSEDWNVEVINTGEDTMTGGRLKKIENLINNETFCFTYGDTLNNVNISKLINFHKKNSKIATVTVSHPPEKYGVLKIDNFTVTDFEEKPDRKNEWVNAGYFVLEPAVFDLTLESNTIWENEPMKNLVSKRQLSAFKHEGFYKSMDSLSDKVFLENLWNKNNAEWKNWS